MVRVRGGGLLVSFLFFFFEGVRLGGFDNDGERERLTFWTCVVGEYFEEVIEAEKNLG